MSDQQLIDNTPHPTILRVLGEIRFLPWQCIAELIDNSLDGFLDMKRQGSPVNNPLITVAFGKETVTVKDNGPGMDFDMLTKAVRAGWSSQTELDSLGLYGMGFNIATAVLGAMTTIRTTRSGDPEWYITEIDLQRLSQAGQYGLPRKTLEKSNPAESGTVIEITRLKSEHKDNFGNQNWVRTNITERLRKVYSTMLREKNPQPIKFTLHINSKKVQAKEHCIWPNDWTVYRRTEGDVSPYREIDVDFGTRYRNRRTGETFDTPDGIPSEDLVEVPQRIYGWIGIQRYLDEKEYGFDLIRNGRKIETDCKDFFTFGDEIGNEQFEYPIDEQRRRRGRIVGELHLDHGHVYYTKERFERNHKSWNHLDKAIRHAEPLTNRGNFGLANTVNNSPLGQLFRVFRRNSPLKAADQTWWDILCFEENETAKQWAEEWRKGTTEYRNNEKWKLKLKSYNNSPAADTSTNEGQSEDHDDATIPAEADPILDFGTGNSGTSDSSNSQNGSDSITVQGGSSDSDTQVVSISAAVPLPELKMHIAGVGLRGNTYDVEAFSIDAASTPGTTPPWYTRPTARGVYEVYLNTQHSVFNSTTLQIRDAVLAEMAYIISKEEDAQASSDDSVSFAEMLVTLRERFSHTDSLDVAQLARDIEEIRKKLIKRLKASLDEVFRRQLIDELPTSEIQFIELAAAQGMTNTPITDYLRMSDISYLIGTNPEALFAAGCFNRPWTPDVLANNSVLLQTHRDRLIRSLSPLFITVSEFTVTSITDATKPYLSYVRASVNRLREFLNTEGAP